MTVKRVVLFSLIGLLVLAIIFGLIFYLISNQKNGGDKKINYYEFKLEEMYTNIAKSDNILKINITIEYTDEKLVNTLNKSKSKITNNILELLRSKTIEQLSGKEGQKNTRADILNDVKEITKSNSVSNIYFTEFIIQ